MSIHTASTDANVPENTMISGIVENMDSLLFSLNRIEAHGLKRVVDQIRPYLIQVVWQTAKRE